MPARKTGIYVQVEYQGYAPSRNLPQDYRESNILEQAKDNYSREIRDIYEELGDAYQINSMLKNSLASVYTSQGQWAKAEELEVQVLETRKRVLGLEHPDTLTSISNLALMYRDQGRWAKAEELQVQVTEIRKRASR
jgi:tetratricopeptide (TPR) repeat protein